MKGILQRYKVLSGHAINYNKSSITVSPNTSVVDRRKVCTTLEVQEISVHGKYLRMPMYMGRNKNEVFGFLVDRVGKKLQGWCNVPLSKGKKLTLLKTAAPALPNFLMNHFLIPTNMCMSIEMKINGLWWGQGANSN